MKHVSNLPFDFEPVAQGLEHLGLLLYDNPLFVLHCASQSHRRVRQSLAMLYDLLDTFGPIESIKRLNQMGSAFLRGFYRDDRGELYFATDDELLYSPILSTVNSLTGRPLDKSDVDVIRYCYTYHVFLGKIPVERGDLLEESLYEWVYRQLTINELQAEQTHLRNLRRIVSWLTDSDGFPMELLHGKHGPGITAVTGKRLNDKEAKIKFTRAQSLLGIPHPKLNRRSEQLSNKWLAVTKDIKSLRPITAEPPSNQYLQQSVKEVLYSLTDRKHINLGHFVKFADQSRSRQLALRGSTLREAKKFVTLDLKSGSDYLSSEIVTEVFGGDLLHLLMGTRSWNTDLPGFKGLKNLELRMFGGMGSALTFPVQTIVYTAIALYGAIIALEGHPPDSLSDYLSAEAVVDPRLQGICVYGDDIIIPDFATETVVNMLNRLGLQVNSAKSFYGATPVRESCGIYAIDGMDITPLRYRLDEKACRAEFITGETFEAIRSYANLAFLYNYRTLYRAAVELLQESKTLLKKRNRTNHDVSGTRVVPQLLFQQVTEEVPIGILSETGDNATHPRFLHERVHGIVTFMPSGDERVETDCEAYHYARYWSNKQLRTYFNGEEEQQAKHKSLIQKIRDQAKHSTSTPTMTRLELRFAYRHTCGNQQTWRWALPVLSLIHI